MLMQIRERASGIFAYIIVALLAIPFALWGIHEYLGGPADQNVAKVNGEEISKRLFDAQLQDQRRYLRSILGDSFDSLYSDENKLKENVLDTLIQNALLGEETRSAGYRISNAKLAERIQSVPQFQEAGRFNPVRYEQLLSSQGRSPGEFEEQLRQEETINQYQGSAVYSSFLPSKYMQRYAALKQQKRNFDYLLLESDPSAVAVSDDEISSYYESNKQLFKSLERVKLEYLEVKQKAIADTLSFSEEELLKSYNDDPTRYQSAELRKANHILFKLAEDAPEEEITAAFEKAKAADERIKNGESFADVAQAVSEDTFSAKNGGNLGYLTRTDIDNPVFMDKLFSMQKGESSAPIKTSLGIQLIQLDDITLPKTKSFAEVRTMIENELRAESSEEEFYQQHEQLSNLTYVNEDNLSVAAEELDMQVQTSDWIVGATAEGIASFPSVVSAAFSDDLLNKGLNSAALEVADGHVMVVRVAEHEPAEIQPLKDVAEQIKATLIQSKARGKLIAEGEEVIAGLKENSQAMDSVAKELNVPLLTIGSLLRDDDSAPAEIVSRVFSLPAPENNTPVFDGVELSDGKLAVVRLNEVIDADEASTKLEQAELISLQGRYGRREMSAMLKALRETGDVVVFPENL